MTPIIVATLNLRNRQNNWRRRRELVVAELVDLQPHLLSLQEIYMPIRQGQWLRNQVNSRLSGSTRQPYHLFTARKMHPVTGYFEGIGVLSRLPVLSYDKVGLGYEGRVALRVNVGLDAGISLDFIALHLHHPATDRQARLDQIMTLTGWLESKNPIPYQIIAGDFNETPKGAAILQMKAHYHSAYETVVGREPLATFPTGLIESDWAGCLDYIFLSRPISTVHAAHLFATKPASDNSRLFPSDHVGLAAEISVAAIS